MVAQEVSEAQQIRALAQVAAANFDRIATWKATFQFEDRYITTKAQLETAGLATPSGNGPWRRRDTGRVTMTFDRQNDGLNVDWQSDASRLTHDDQNVEIAFTLESTCHQRSVVSLDKYLFQFPDEKYGDFRNIPSLRDFQGRAAFRDPLEEAAKLRHSLVFGPRELFSFSRTFWEDLEAAAGVSESLANGSLSVTQMSPDRVVEVLELPDGDTVAVTLNVFPSVDAQASDALSFQYLVSRKQACNFKSVNVRDSKSRDVQGMAWEYREQDGIWLPSKVIRRMMQSDGETISSMRTLQLDSSEINVPIDPEQFTHGFFGLQDGDLLVDRVSESYQVMKNGALGEPIPFAAPPADRLQAPSSQGISTTTMLLFGNAIILLAILAFAISRKWARR
ncbi:MAG: hypothetical protein B7Z55_07855 [Planctomycetales bacterium 12-60-4]|nr:MAG: hypothetical protein B7Z55_07855 [Planctomycetales bacterium 12-60-4]